ncbi:MAG: ATP-binding protein [Flavobacteriales bacterium]|nr:ATP-binding protein [Flavobacteriales bacterium]MCB9193189.1 ATP-binding protein [Flavobacteriales bacterium]
MKLVTFTVSDYRSITKAYKLPLGDFAVLVGPNNEGKSNVLKAMVLSLGLLSRSRYFRAQRQLRYAYGENTYDWKRDYPVQSQKDYPDGRSEFILEFELTAAELTAFNRKVKIQLATNLKLKLSCGSSDALLDIVLPGKAKTKLTKRPQADQWKEEMARFVNERLDIQYIPALRPSDMAERVVEDLLARELAQLEAKEEYRELVKSIEEIQRPILESLSNELTTMVASFIPEVRSVTLKSGGGISRALRRSARVLVNDGTETELEMKGDGIKSLTAISLLRHVSQRSLGTKGLILAIEEPESHLHPRAIHRLREVLADIAKSHQVILTTHSPVLVDRYHPSRNIIVQKGKAAPAGHISAVRDALGVRIADNLATASLILVCEGKEDEQVLRAWLPLLSKDVGRALADGNLSIDPLVGASNLGYKVRLHKSYLCGVHAFLDNDQAGRKAIELALDQGTLDHSEYHLASAKGFNDSELEDFIKPEIYQARLLSDLRVEYKPSIMRTSKGSWSDRMKLNCKDQGKEWSKSVESQVKGIVSNCAAAAGLESLIEGRRGSIDALVKALEERLHS